MIIENTPVSYLVEFDTGTPTGVFSYSLLDESGDIVANIQDQHITIAPDAVSVLIQIPAQANTLTKPLFESRTIWWTYVTDQGAVTGSYDYSIQKRLPFPATNSGVRIKLGLDETELPDDRINLLMAYVELNQSVSSGFDDYEGTGDITAMKIASAIEAAAALQLIPTLQLSIAKRLTSGTNEYERWSSVDWQSLVGQLQQEIYDLSVIIDTTLVFDVSPVFTLAIRTDPYTGS